jgi:hypothetical protein
MSEELRLFIQNNALQVFWSSLANAGVGFRKDATKALNPKQCHIFR